MPGYGVPTTLEGALPWSWAAERLGASHNYWVATARPDGRPHVTAVWAVWLDGLLCFSCATNSVKARNLARDARCTVTTERADEAVIVEGVAEELTDVELLARFKSAYDEKYGWDMDVTQGGIFAVRPTRAFGFIEHEGQFQQTATRWAFGREV
jgi:PPOX class probable F420-dependent enzyme